MVRLDQMQREKEGDRKMPLYSFTILRTEKDNKVKSISQSLFFFQIFLKADFNLHGHFELNFHSQNTPTILWKMLLLPPPFTASLGGDWMKKNISVLFCSFLIP